MKVLMLHNDYLQAGGERVSVSTEESALREAGVDVHLLKVDNSKYENAGALEKAASTFPSSAANTLVRDAIRDFKPDVVHAQNLFPQLGAGAIRAIEEANVPWVRTIRNYRLSCIAGTFVRDGRPCHDCEKGMGNVPGVVHGCYQDSRVRSLGATNYAGWERRAERAFPPSAYVLVSAAMQRHIRTALLPDIPQVVVHNAVSHPAASTTSMSSRTYDVAFVGRLAAEKGLDIVLALARSRPDLDIMIAGTGPMSSTIESVAGQLPRLSYKARLDQLEVAELMDRTRVVVVPSQWEEPFGRVAAEALSCGAIPLVSTLGGLPEIVEGLPYRAAIDPTEPSEWFLAVEAILRLGASEQDAVSEACQAQWRGRFSPSALASKLLKIYDHASDGIETT